MSNAQTQYPWTDNPTVSGVSPCDTDVLNDCLMHLKYENTNDTVQNMYPTGAVETETRGLGILKNMAHSTYCGDQAYNATPHDSKKLDRHGSVKVTEDGIANGFTQTSYLGTTLDLTGKSSLRIDFANISAITGETPTHQAFFELRPSSSISAFGVRLFKYTGTNNNLGLIISNGSGGNTTLTYSSSFSGTLYSGYIEIKNGVLTSEVNGISISSSPISLTQDQINSIFVDLVVSLGATTKDGSNQYIRDGGYFDVKQFSIRADGFEVFSGNKTGIDTIKPTDFQVITTMYAYVYDGNTIYADSDSAPTELYDQYGRLVTQSASGWQIDGTSVKYNGNTATYTSASNKSYIYNPPLPCSAGVKINEIGIINNTNKYNYITKTGFSVPSGSKKVDIYGRFKIGSNDTTNSFWSALFAVGKAMLQVRYSSVNSHYHLVPFEAQNSSFPNTDNNDVNVVQPNVLYEYKINVNLESSTVKFYYKQLTQDAWTQMNIANLGSSAWITACSNATYIRLGYSDQTNNARNIEQDANSFKVYIDDELAHQPCLKIPYTFSDTGSLIVDSIYRDRVIDVYNEKGEALYYTLGESDYTLPMGELYGMITKRKTNAPDYSKVVNLWSLDGSMTIDWDGWLLISMSTNDTTQVWGVTVNNVKVCATPSTGTSGYYHNTALVMVSSGDVVAAPSALSVQLYRIPFKQ